MGLQRERERGTERERGFKSEREGRIMRVWWREDPQSLPRSTLWLAARPHILSSLYVHSHMATHARMTVHMYTHSHRTKPIIQSESMHKFSSGGSSSLSCEGQSTVFLSEPAVWQIPSSSIYICAQPASSSSSSSSGSTTSSSSCSLFLPHLPALSLVFIHSLPAALSFHSFISPFHPPSLPF